MKESIKKCACDAERDIVCFTHLGWRRNAILAQINEHRRRQDKLAEKEQK